MHYKRIGRALVCLLLVCCLIVNVSPVKARAVDPATAIAFDFAARSVIASAMQGLGVSKGSDPTVFDGIVNRAIDVLSFATNFITEGHVKLARITSSLGDTMFLLPISILSSIMDFFTSNDVVVSAPSYGTFVSGGTNFFDHPYSTSSYVANNDGYVFRFVSDYEDLNSYTLIWVFCTYTPSLSVNNSTSSVKWTSSYGDTIYYYTVSGGCYNTGGALLGSCYPTPVSNASAAQTLAFKFMSGQIADNPTYSTDMDLTLGNIGDFDDSFVNSYPSWAENTVFVPGSVYGSDDDYVPSVPIAVAPDYEGTTNMSQSDVQAGNSTWVDTETDTDIGTDTSPEALAGTIATTIAWDFISGLFDVFIPGFELISNTIEGIGALIKALPQTLKDVFGIDVLLEKIGAIYETVVQGFLDTITGIRSIPQAIADVLTAIFVPSSDYITAKVEAIRAKFPFMDSIIATGEYIRDSLSGSSGPPAIYVDLSLADGNIDYGEKTLLTDFSWYAPYKGTVDSVLGAALWAFFGWRVFLRLPGLISGADGYVGEIRTLSSRSSGAGGRKKED